MPPEIKKDRRAMLDCAIEIIEEGGFGAVSARSLARRLGISTQPIYREFGDMEGVRKAALGRGYEIFAEYLGDDALEQAARYIMFACERGRLFNFLFRYRNNSFSGLGDMAHSIISSTGIIDKLMDITGLPREKVYDLHLYVWMALHGLAVMVAENNVTLSEDEIKNFTQEITRAMSSYYKE